MSTRRRDHSIRAIELIARHYETISNLGGTRFVLDGGRAGVTDSGLPAQAGTVPARRYPLTTSFA